MLEIKLSCRNYWIAQFMVYILVAAVLFNTLLALVPFHWRASSEINEPTLMARLDYLKKIDNIREPIIVRSYWTSMAERYTLHIFRDENGRAVIFMSSRFNYQELPDETVSVLLAHELGHLKSGHCLPGFKDDRKRLSDDEMEVEANASALRLLGQEVFIKGYSMYASQEQVIELFELAQKYNDTHKPID